MKLNYIRGKNCNMEDREIVKELYIELCNASINKDVDTFKPSSY